MPDTLTFSACQLLPSLLDNLNAADPESVLNSAVLLCSILDQSSAVPAYLSEPLEQAQARCEGLVRACLGGERCEEGVLNLAALDVLLKVLARCRELRLGRVMPGSCAALILQVRRLRTPSSLSPRPSAG